jgi:hypothetical protein
MSIVGGSKCETGPLISPYESREQLQIILNVVIISSGTGDSKDYVQR